MCNPDKVDRHSWYRPAIAESAALLLLLAIGVARITSTYSVFNHTYDEPFHIARGYRWWKGYSYVHTLHPPLAPILVGVGPVLSVTDISLSGDKRVDGNAILYAGDYWRTLTSARAGNLVFFVWATLGIWMLGRMTGGPVCACVATAVFTSMPAVLAHSGLATTDLAITATLTTSLWALRRWLHRAEWSHAIVLGVAWSLTLLAKHSAIVFLPICIVAAVCCGHRDRNAAPQSGSRWPQVVTAALIAWYVVWAVYCYSVGTISASSGLSGSNIAVSGLGDWVQNFSVPAPEYWCGILELASKNNRGHAPFFWGVSAHAHGHWAFFPVVLSVKTPIAYLALFLIGGVVAFRSENARGARTPALASLWILIALSMLSRINLGVRHLLPLYPLLCICAGAAAQWMWTAHCSDSFHLQDNLLPRGTDKSAGGHSHGVTLLLRRGFAVGLIGSGFTSSLAAHPDYIGYFNLIAGSRPEQIVVDSDLDWGQDLERLRQEFGQRGITSAHLAYFGTADPLRHGFSVGQIRPVNADSTGWIAISHTLLAQEPRYSWLKEHVPVMCIGTSILLYRVPPRSNVHEAGVKLTSTRSTTVTSSDGDAVALSTDGR